MVSKLVSEVFVKNFQPVRVLRLTIPGMSFPVHGGNESKFVTILRTFDLSCEYGPCVGVSRLERWERAQDMGLDPPQEVTPS
jgi:hypothetical protein